MAIILKNSWNVPPVRWGSFADVQYAIKVNAEKVYNVDPDNYILIMPLFWGFPALDYSSKRHLVDRYGVLYKDNTALFDGDSNYLDVPYKSSLNVAEITIETRFAVAPGSLNSGKFLVQKAYTSHASPYYQYGLMLLDTGAYLKNLWFRVTVGGTLFDLNYEETSFKYETEHTFVGSYDQEDMRIYFDGGYTRSSPDPSGAMSGYASDLEIGAYPNLAKTSTYCFGGKIYDVRISKKAFTEPEDARLFYELPYGLYQRVARPFYLLPVVPGPTTKFYDLNTEISGGSESIQDLITDIQANAESFFDLETEISATTTQTILDLNTEIAADYNLSFEDVITDIQAVAELLTDLNIDLSATIQPETIIDLNTDIQAVSNGIYYDLTTDIKANKRLFYDLNTEIAVIRSKYWLDTEIEALSYARWSFNTEWNPNRFLNTEIAAKKPYTFSFKTKTGSSYVASSSEIEILLSGYSWPLRTLFLDYLRVGTSNVYNFELWWARGQSGKNPLKNAKIKAEYTNTQFAGGYEVVTCDWLSVKIDGGASQTVNATPLDLGDLPCDSKLDIELTVDCRDCSLSRGLIFFRLIITGDYAEAIYGAPIVYGDGTQYFEGEQDDYQSNNFIARLYVVG